MPVFGMPWNRPLRLAVAFVALSLAPACTGAVDPTPPVPIERDFGSKIVYGTSPGVAAVLLARHCRELDGDFNRCGSICAPGAATCATVCAYTCDDIPNRPTPQ